MSFSAASFIKKLQENISKGKEAKAMEYAEILAPYLKESTSNVKETSLSCTLPHSTVLFSVCSTLLN